MASIIKPLTTKDKLTILSRDSQYDLACACGTTDAERRRRSDDGTWLYPVTLPDGGTSVLLKTLISNVCLNDCGYCPLRAGVDVKRCVMAPEEIVSVFLDYLRRRIVSGLFISSGVTGCADSAMEQINRVASILRKKERFRGYIHLKIIPGASDAAIEQALSLATTVSINIETPGEENFKRICGTKRYQDDIIRPLKIISRLTAKGERYAGVKQTTQFVVGASEETDAQIVQYSGALYKKLGVHRIYFSAYQRGLGAAGVPGEHSPHTNTDLLTREHRLYQTDWLMRKYGFSPDEIPFESNGGLSLTHDPKEMWAQRHPEFFPVNVNRASKWDLLRVPGLGPVVVNRIMKRRKDGGIIRIISELGRVGKVLGKAERYVKFG